MQTSDTIRKAIQELILPELSQIKAGYSEIKSILELTNKRIDDIHTQLAQQSKRIDENTNRIDEINRRIDETNNRIDLAKDELVHRIDKTNIRLDQTNERINRLYEVVVRRDEHEILERRFSIIENEIAELKKKVA